MIFTLSPTLPCTFRVANSADVDLISDTWLQGASAGFGCGPIPDRTQVGQFFRSTLKTQPDGRGIWLATSPKGDYLGWQAMLTCRNNPVDYWTTAEISTYIEPKWRNLGYGRHFLRFVSEQAVRVHVTQLRAFVSVFNFASVQMLQSAGYIRVGEVPALASAGSRFYYYAAITGANQNSVAS